MKVVYFDFETSGITDDKPNIQLAAIAVDEKWTEVDSFEMKIQFNESEADKKALEINHYDPAVWAQEAKPQHQVISMFDAFLVKHKDIQMTSKKPPFRPYSVARLAGHNAASFDMPRLRKAYGAAFLPAHPLVLDTLQLALWHFNNKPQPENYQLTTLLKHFGDWLPKMHDALGDVRAAAELAKCIAIKQWQDNEKIPAGR